MIEQTSAREMHGKPNLSRGNAHHLCGEEMLCQIIAHDDKLLLVCISVTIPYHGHQCFKAFQVCPVNHGAAQFLMCELVLQFVR